MGLVMDKWHGDRSFSKSLSFPLSAPFHHFSMFSYVSSKSPLDTQFHRDIVSPHHSNKKKEWRMGWAGHVADTGEMGKCVQNFGFNIFTFIIVF
jgi:hypothetical protein